VVRRVIVYRISGILVLWLELPPLLPLPVAKYQSVKLLNQLINQLIHQFAVRKSALERMHREDPRSCWKDSSADFGWLRANVARSNGCSEAVDGNCDVRKAICFSAGRCTESFDSKLALRQRRYVLVEGILAPNNPDLNPLNYYVWSVVERVKSQTSLGFPMWYHRSH